MSYSTPTAIIQRYGLEEVTQLLADEQQLLTSQLLLDAIAVAGGGAWTGSPTAQEQAAANDAVARLEHQLTVASNFMDGYLRAAVTLPLTSDDANAATLRDCCEALARCGLADDTDNSTERIDKCCDTWRNWLRDVAARRVQLVTNDGSSPATAPGGVRSGQAQSAYCWGSFGSVR